MFYDIDPFATPQPAFPQALPLPHVEPDDLPSVTAVFSCEYLKYVIGALKYLTQQSTWDTDDPTAMKQAIGRFDDLIDIFVQAGASGCAPQSFSCAFDFSSSDGAPVWQIDISGGGTNNGQYFPGSGYQSTCVSMPVVTCDLNLVSLSPKMTVDSMTIDCDLDVPGANTMIVTLYDELGNQITQQIDVTSGVHTYTLPGTPYNNVAKMTVQTNGVSVTLISAITVNSHAIANPCAPIPLACLFDYTSSDGGWTPYTEGGLANFSYVSGVGWYRPLGSPYGGAPVVLGAIAKHFASPVDVDSVVVRWESDSSVGGPNHAVTYIVDVTSGFTVINYIDAIEGDGPHDVVIPCMGHSFTDLAVRVQCECVGGGCGGGGSVDANMTIIEVQVNGHGTGC